MSKQYAWKLCDDSVSALLDEYYRKEHDKRFMVGTDPILTPTAICAIWSLPLTLKNALQTAKLSHNPSVVMDAMSGLVHAEFIEGQTT